METASFAELGLSSKVYEAVAAAGYTQPTPIQAQAIPVAVTGKDVLGIAQTGTGKTAAFVLPMITRLESGRARARMPRTLILAPTRELAAQVAEAFEKYGVNHKLTLALLIGGVSFDEQNRKLDRGVDVLIATPGRLLDHIQRGKLLLTGVEILVIDEADRMLDMGFIPDIEKICKLLPPRRQTLFFSATMPPEIQRLVDQFLKDPACIEVARPATTAQTITQRFQFCADGEDWAKREMLRDLIHGQDVQNAIIFCNRKRDVAILHKSLIKHGFNAGALHGDMDQSNRTATLDKFRNGEITILAASDVAARGLDIPEVSHVFNFDVPWVGDDYVHRIGRTGRAGREGYAATLVAPDDLKLLQGIESVTGEKAVWIGDAPTEEDFAESGKKRRGRGGRGNSSSSRSSSSTARGRRPSRGKSQENEPEETANAQPPSRRRNTRSTPPPVELDAEQTSSPRRRRARKSDAEIPGSGEQPVIDANALAPAPVEEVVPASKSRSRNAPNRNARPERPSRARARPQEDRSNAPAGGNSNSFHEGNLPAFLQRPVRPEKPAKKPGRTAREEPTAEIDG
ncbi:MAG: DEAD/DEAH box helicase [Hyphomicrobiaceae bacterium]